MEQQSAKDYLLSIPFWTKQKNSFEVIRLFLQELGCVENMFRILHVAGTNGKGSVCAFLTSVLCEAGFRTGTFTSPHLTDIRERFMVDGKLVSQEMFEYAFMQVKNVSEKMVQASHQHPTFFEFVFLMAMVIFKECQVEYVVLETGLGGRQDTTNVFTHPQISVLTSISMDHMEYLGDTIQKIAAEKAGIIKPGVPVVYDDSSEEVSRIIREKAGLEGAELSPVNQAQLQSVVSKGSSLSVTLQEGEEHYSYEIPFAAEYQAMNAAIAIRTVKMLQLPIPQAVLEAGIKKTVWPGRMEEIYPGVYVDGAHNAGGIAAFIRTASRLSVSTGRKICLLFAAVSDKEYVRMIESLCRELTLAHVVTAQMKNSRSLEDETLEQTFRTYAACPVMGFTSVEDAVEAVLEHRTGDELVFCVGSLYLVGEIKAVLQSKEEELP